MSNRGPFPVLKQERHEIDYSSPTSVRLQMGGVVPLLPLHAVMVWIGINIPFFYCR
jgi:hypothetical protein